MSPPLLLLCKLSPEITVIRPIGSATFDHTHSFKPLPSSSFASFQQHLKQEGDGTRERHPAFKIFTVNGALLESRVPYHGCL